MGDQGGDLGAESRSTEELGRQRRKKGHSGPGEQHEQGVGWGGVGQWLKSWQEAGDGS